MTGLTTRLLLGVAGFVAMEGVSYATHRWVMHGVGMIWHRSHHARSEGGWEANDRFPLLFSVIGFATFVLAIGTPWLRPVAIGITAYGAAYLFVHEVYIHERLRWRVPKNAYMEHLRDAHALHHRFGGEPYGMLLPVVPRSLRERAAGERPSGGRVPARADDAALARRASARETRSRL
jgi:beta-carotene 3-hydroxylase